MKITYKIDFDMVFGILNFDLWWRFFKGYRPGIMANFQNRLISRIFNVFHVVFFAHNICKSLVDYIFTFVLEIEFLTQRDEAVGFA